MAAVISEHDGKDILREVQIAPERHVLTAERHVVFDGAVYPYCVEVKGVCGVVRIRCQGARREDARNVGVKMCPARQGFDGPSLRDASTVMWEKAVVGESIDHGTWRAHCKNGQPRPWTLNGGLYPLPSPFSGGDQIVQSIDEGFCDE